MVVDMLDDFLLCDTPSIRFDAMVMLTRCARREMGSKRIPNWIYVPASRQPCVLPYRARFTMLAVWEYHPQDPNELKNKKRIQIKVFNSFFLLFFSPVSFNFILSFLKWFQSVLVCPKGFWRPDVIKLVVVDQLPSCNARTPRLVPDFFFEENGRANLPSAAGIDFLVSFWNFFNFVSLVQSMLKTHFMQSSSPNSYRFKMNSWGWMVDARRMGSGVRCTVSHSGICHLWMNPSLLKWLRCLDSILWRSIELVVVVSFILIGFSSVSVFFRWHQTSRKRRCRHQAHVWLRECLREHSQHCFPSLF